MDAFLAFFFRKKYRGFWSLLKLHRLLSGRAGLIAATRYGSRLELIPSDYIDAHVLKDGYYESEIMEGLLPFLGKDCVFWDVGANLGLHSVTAKFLKPETIVVAFEPNPAMCERIRKNATLNGLEVQVARLALSEHSGKQMLSLINQGNPGMSTLHPSSGTVYENVLEVDCSAGWDLVREGFYPAPTVIKIDVEGEEAPVIRGLGQLLHLPSLKALIFEAESGLEQSGEAHSILGPLRSAGFHVRALNRNEKTSHLLENYLATRN